MDQVQALFSLESPLLNQLHVLASSLMATRTQITTWQLQEAKIMTTFSRALANRAKEDLSVGVL
jgi:hypothetical protein